jgi:putative ABC transport system permease protein
VSHQTAVFLTDGEAARLAGHTGQVDAIGVLAGPGFGVSSLRVAAPGASVLTGAARGQAEYPGFERTRTPLIPVTAAFGGLAMFIAMFVVASTMGLSIQQREREIALLRAVAATPGQIRRLIAWETALIGVIGSAAGIWPGFVLGRALTHALVRHGIAPPDYVVSAAWLPAAALAEVWATPGVRSTVALTATTLGPSLGESSDLVPAQILAGGQGGGLDVGVTAGSLAALHGDAIALGRRRAAVAHAHIGDRVAVMLGDGTRTHATVVAIYSHELGFGDALLAPELAAGHQTSPLLGTILVTAPSPAIVAVHLRALSLRYPGLRVSDRASLTTATDADREMNHWLGPLFEAMIFAFTSIAVLNTLAMIALRRRREVGLLRLVGATPRQVRSMARWEAGLIVTIGLGLGLAISATALLPLSHAVNGSLRPYMPPVSLAMILGTSTLLALLGVALPTRRALRARPAEAIGVGE